MSELAAGLVRLWFYCKYFLETAGLLLLFLPVLPRRRWGPAFAAGALAAGLIVSVCWSQALSDQLALRLVRYFLLTGTVCALSLGLFDTTPFFALYAGMTAVALQHIAYRLQQLAVEALGLSVYSPAGIALGFACLAAAAALGYLLLIRRLKGVETGSMRSLPLLYTGSGIVTIVLVLSMVPQDGFPAKARMLTCLYDLIGCGFGLALLYAEYETGRLASEVITLQELIRKEERQREVRAENVELVNIKCHDIRKRLATLGSRLEEHEIRELENLVEIYDSSYQTGCRALDVLLAERSLYCGQHGIRLTCMAEGGKLGFLSAADVYSIFGNAIDNAVTAVEALPPEKRVISLTVRENLGMLCVRVENYCEGDVDLSGGLPQTTKADRDYHGFGMKSMDYTVKKYGGTLSVKAADGLFILDILLPLP